MSPRYAELAATTNFSFLRGASHPEELVAAAMALGLAGLGIADRNSLAGVVRAHRFLKANKSPSFHLAIGARLVFCDGAPDILSYPRDRAAYGRLTRLLTRANARAQKGVSLLRSSDLIEAAQGQQLILMPETTWEKGDETRRSRKIHAELHDNNHYKNPVDLLDDAHALAFGQEMPLIEQLREASNGRLWLAAKMTYGVSMRRDLASRIALSRKTNTPLIAVNDVIMHTPERRPLQDVLSAIRAGQTLDRLGLALEANAERHMKSAAEMARLFAGAPQAMEETLRFLDGLDFSLDELRGDYPEELREGFETPQAALAFFAREGAKFRFPDGVPPSVETAIAHELKLVEQLDYAPYFLTVHDIVRFARTEKILCQGRGSAANSTLCYCLGVTEVNPAFHNLLFERFISPDRNEPPDIDVDFEHERREQVMQYIYARYGRARAALTASVITYRARSAIREVGKAFGLSDDVVSALSATIWGGSSSSVEAGEAQKAGFDPTEARLAQTLKLAEELIGFPRHLSQHTGGFVITRSRLDEVVPIMNAAMEDRTTIEWDKDDLDALGILKIDVLALGMLTCLRKGFDLIREHYGEELTIATLPPEQGAVYEMISRADTIGVFQIESRAQMSMLPRLRPREFYDLVIEVAIVRPGPIQGDMVHPYLRRRQGLEPVSYPSKQLEEVLGKTLGVPLFQEQAMKIAIVAAGFTPSEADQLRRAMATFKHVGTIGAFRAKMIEGMVARDYSRDFAERCFKQIEGFGSYGFPESHAASFALLVYASAWMKCRYPDAFACALLNAQPMGFYAPAQILRDAREHGVGVEEVDVNFSHWDSTLTPAAERRPPHPRHASMQGEIFATCGISLGFRQIKGFAEHDATQLVAMRDRGYDSIRDLWLRAGLSLAVMELLAGADAFRSLGLDRREALWAVRGLNRAGDKDDLPLLKDLSWRATEAEAKLPPMLLGEHVVEDYRRLSLSLKAHPVSFLRERLTQKRILRADDLKNQPAGSRITVAGLVLVRQRPGTASGVIFLTIEDETGIANAIVWPKIFERLRRIVIGARFLAVTGRLQKESDVIHVVMERAEDLSPLLALLSDHGGAVSSLARADEVRRPNLRDSRAPREPVAPARSKPVETPSPAPPQEDWRRVLPKGRNFH
ncbi:DNA polymerase III, alpha subunit [Methylocella silvestris BL2]|uniref:Error-prone DNA polymerase n=1 Tax=Methylocella silvestris (strain DSM 15510 / CIP 108128 / LMG 27833 / NCIMB 13906 / BL2) TaxID=395965 RepID=B8ELP6_METSB|nr:error-prone DNA polymerase [Methylocella silvestris]ACK50040.1 DNA polymerase III, alpha subunit [Methylocella silvestris BL2]